MLKCFPLSGWNGNIPLKPHPGSFGVKRKHDIHTGIDLYCNENANVFAVEDGVVLAIEEFTGPKANSPWWLSTKCLLVEGESGVVCYGEIEPNVSVGNLVKSGQKIANVLPVLKKTKTDIKNHSRWMLHFELYTHGTRETIWWRLEQPQPDNLLDPTDLLIGILNA
jgi:murein DD-endopeptidase MepM/ murein hydrolase activator NlpD